MWQSDVTVHSSVFIFLPLVNCSLITLVWFLPQTHPQLDVPVFCASVCSCATSHVLQPTSPGLLAPRPSSPLTWAAKMRPTFATMATASRDSGYCGNESTPGQKKSRWPSTKMSPYFTGLIVFRRCAWSPAYWRDCKKIAFTQRFNKHFSGSIRGSAFPFNHTNDMATSQSEIGLGRAKQIDSDPIAPSAVEVFPYLQRTAKSQDGPQV